VRVPAAWLGELVSWEGPIAALCERLTTTGLKVESLEEVGRVDPRVRVGRLVAVDPHAGADRLRVCRVDVGAGERIVVSAAPDLRPGRRVPVALPGARLATGALVEAADVCGIRSEGVLCSEVEIGLGDDAGGVLELPADAAPGTPVAELPGVADTVVELEVSPYRGDCLSVLGVAREVAAVTGARLRAPRVRLREGGAAAAGEVRLRVDAPDLCPRYCARILRDVTIGPSPFWLRLRLRRAGMRPINAVVDATNYVMLERGQPLHAFDLDRLAGREIVVRRAVPEEGIVTLDGVPRMLAPDDLVIADARRAVAIAGVMGGEDSEVRAETRAILLESAFFTPPAVRRTSRRLGLPSQASYRFERRVDPEGVAAAADAAAALIARLGRAEVAPGIVEASAGVEAHLLPPVRLRPARVAGLLGVPLRRGEILRRLRAVGARCRTENGAIVVTPPSHRGDLRLEEDLAEEVARLAGYDRLPVTLPAASIVAGSESAIRLLAGRVRRLLVAEGLSEMVTLAFTDAGTNARLPGWVGRDLRPVGLANPLSSDAAEMRRSPLGGLVRALVANRAQGAGWVGAFELGKAYGRNAAGAVAEPRAIGVLLAGMRPPWGVERQGPPVEFADLKGTLDNLLAGLGLAAAWRPAADVPFLHPGKAAGIEIEGRRVGVAGALHPEVAQAFDLTGEVWIAELDFEMVGHYVPRRSDLRPLPRYPAVARDIAVIVDETFLADAILEEIRALRDPRIESARVFDCYRGAPVPAGQKSLAYAIAYRAADRTLTDDEVNALHDRVRAHLTERFALTLRS
jgi:phenylalanyl-tRNA synthetase beta chain